MERWRIFGLTTLGCVVFLAGLFVAAEAGRARLREASQQMQAAMERRILAGDLRQQVGEAALATRSFLLTGREAYLDLVRDSGRDIGRTADAFIAAYAGEPSEAGEDARQLRYLAGVQAGATLSLVSLHATRGAAAARELARAQSADADPLAEFLRVADRIERYEQARIRAARAGWQREQRLAWQLTLAGTTVTLLLVASASLLALAAVRRHREGLEQIARRRDELEHDAAAREAELSEVYGHLQTLQEQERSRLARGLHDELGGLLLAARMDVTWLKQRAHEAAPEALAARIDRVLDVLDQGIDLKRRVIEELRPTLLDNMGLFAAIRWQADEAAKRSGLRCDCHFPATEPEVSPQTAIALFRVVQEALTNVQKHAQASHVVVSLDANADQVLLAVADDGRGLVAEEVTRAPAYGLAGMKHRIVALGGTLTLGPSPEGGTEVRAIVPRGSKGDAGARPGGPPRATVSRMMGRLPPAGNAGS